MSALKDILSTNLRRLRGLKSQDAIAEMSDISLRQYARYESGEAWPPAEIFENFATALETSPSKLLEDEEVAYSSPNRSYKHLNLENPQGPDLVAFLDMIVDTTPERRALVVAILTNDRSLIPKSMLDRLSDLVTQFQAAK